jgi:hypothetical protein
LVRQTGGAAAFNREYSTDPGGVSPIAIACPDRHSGRGAAPGVTKDRSMSKKPSVKSDYHAKKDRLEITIKHSGLKKKSERKELVKQIEQNLKRGADDGGKARGRRPENPYKQTRIPEVGD